MISLDMGELQKNNELLQNINEELSSLFTKVKDELNNICGNVGSKNLIDANRRVLNEIDFVSDSLFSNLDKLYVFLKRQLSLYSASNEEAKKELSLLIAILDKCFDDNGNIVNDYETANYLSDKGKLGTNIVNYAKEFVGNPYVYGGDSLTNGIDCSGFTEKVYQKFGYEIGATTYNQQKVGTTVSLNDLQPGDLIFYDFKGSGNVTHVAIYAGDDTIVHAANETRGITTDTYSTYGNPLFAKRVI